MKKIISYVVLIAMFINILNPIFTLAEDTNTSANPAVGTTSIAQQEAVVSQKSTVTYGPYKGVDAGQKHAYEPFREKEELDKKIEEIKLNGNYQKDTVLIKMDTAETQSGFVANSSKTNEFVKLEPLFNASTTKSIYGFQSSLGSNSQLSKWHVGKLAEGVEVVDAIKALSEMPNVIAVEPNYIRTSTGGKVPDATTDPNIGKQWFLDRVQIKAAWAKLEAEGLNPGGNRDVVVAVIDTGVDYNHPELAGNMWVNTAEFNGIDGYDDDQNGFVDDIHGATTVGEKYAGESGDPMDDHGHGTHVAGVIAATGGNNEGGAGVAHNVQIMAVKAAQSGGILTSKDIAEAIRYASQMGADVINMSFGGYGRSVLEEDALQDAYGTSVLIAAAGNDGRHNDPRVIINGMPGAPMYPAAYPWVLGVMAGQKNQGPNGDNLASFSNWDVNPEDAYEYEVMAPGVDIYSTLPNKKFAEWDGTSMAAPVVSGIAALVRTKFSDKTSYSSRFIMGQLSATGDMKQGKTYSQSKPPVYYREVNALDAITEVPKPSLSYIEHYIFDSKSIDPNNDGDGVADAGETIDIGMVIRNHWGKADNVVVKIDATNSNGYSDPYATFVQDTVEYGAVGNFGTDDNGFTYVNEAVTSVTHPFRIKIADNTPNDHMIPINITITGRNGFDAKDTTVYASEDKIAVFTRNGVELPPVISSDMTLTKDKYWIVPYAVLIEEGATVTVEPGTQIQFWSSEPEDAYAEEKSMAYIEVRGKFLVNGTAEEPVDMFASGLFPGYEVKIYSDEYLNYHGDAPSNYRGYSEIRYARVMNPNIAVQRVEHCYFSQDLFERMYKRHLDQGKVVTYEWLGPVVYAEKISDSIFYKLGVNPWNNENIYDYNMLRIRGASIGNLFDSCIYYMDERIAEDNVYLKNYKLNRQIYGDRDYWVSKGGAFGTPIDPKIALISVFPVKNNNNGSTYVAVKPNINTISAYENVNAEFNLVQRYAKQIGGNIVSINDAVENEFVRSYIVSYLLNQSLFTNTYPLLKYDNFISSYFNIGLNDISQEGTFQWADNQEVGYTNWHPGQPNNQDNDGNYSWDKNADIVSIDTSGYWRDRNYNNSIYILEIPGDSYVEGITLNKHFLTLGAGGQSVQLQATFKPATATNQNVTWNSSNPAVASVDETGVVTPIQIGTATITATAVDGGFKDICEINVIQIVPATGVILDKSEATLHINKSITLNASLTPFDTTNRNVTWSTSDDQVAIVNNDGKVTGIAPGVATITVKTQDGGYTADCMVNVLSPVTGVKLDQSYLRLVLGDASTTINAIVEPVNATNRNVLWSSSNTNVATVSAAGEVIAVGEGTTMIIAATEDGGFKASCIVTVWPNAVNFSSTRVYAGYNHTLAINNDGTAWAWGKNDQGQLGEGTVVNRSTPVQVRNSTDIVDVAAGPYFSLAAKADGTAWVWGQNSYGVFGNGMNWGNSNEPIPVQDMTGAKAVSVTEYSSYVLKKDGTVWAWGCNENGQLGDGTNVNRYTPIQVENISDVVTIDGGRYHAMALQNDGTVWTWGYNGYGQLGNGSFSGSNIPIQVKNLTGVIDIAAAELSGYAVKSDGSVWFWGHKDGIGNYSEPIQIAELADIVKVDAGEGFAVFLKKDGTVLSMGRNNYGQLGDGTSITSHTPVQVKKIQNVIEISAGQNHATAILSDGTVWSWGYNTFGQLGDITTTNSNEPVQTLFGILPDNNPPQIAFTEPSNGVTGVSANTLITIYFNEGIKSGVDFGLISLKDSSNSTVSLKSKTIMGNKLVLQPISQLTAGNTYTVRMPAKAIKDMFNNEFNSEFSFSFTVSTEASTSITALAENDKFVSTEMFTVAQEDRELITQADIDIKRVEFLNSGGISVIRNNAILNRWWDPDVSHWMRFTSNEANGLNNKRYIANNFWGITSDYLIEKALIHFNDYRNMEEIVFAPILTTAPETAYPFVTDIYVSTATQERVTQVGADNINIHVLFNRDMNQSVQPKVSFGPDMPVTDYRINGVEGGWITPRHWVGETRITPLTGDGYQFFRVVGAQAANDPWLVTGNDEERFRFEIITSGTESMNLQASGGLNQVLLSWTQDDFDMLAGYNVYRSSSMDGQYEKINNTVIPADTKEFTDKNVTAGMVYYYKFKVVKTDLQESDYSNTAAAAPYDNIAPVVIHEPIKAASIGMPLQIFATVTDNVGVEKVELYYKNANETEFKLKQMILGSNSRYSTTLEGSLVKAPGIDYYIKASDGLSDSYCGDPAVPNKIIVSETPLITAISPNTGSDKGGTGVVITGANFKAGAQVTFGGAIATNVVVESANRITATTPAHYAATVDVTVTNTDGYKNTLLRGFVYKSEGINVSIGNFTGNVGNIIKVPIRVENVAGLRAGDLTLNYDAQVLKVLSITKGDITSNFSMDYNNMVPGQEDIYLASSTPVSGSGIIAIVEFRVLQSEKTTSPLTLAKVILNSGAIAVNTANGNFVKSDTYFVSGSAYYYSGSKSISNVDLNLQGDVNYSAKTDTNGNYTINGVQGGKYLLKADKNNDATGITAYDASLVLQYLTSKITLNEHQLKAADVDNSGKIDSMDAAYILEKSVDLLQLPFPGQSNAWRFSPEQINYDLLNANMSNQSFVGILIGDVSGNWGSAETTSTQGANSGILGVINNIIGNETKMDFSIQEEGSRVKVQIYVKNSNSIYSSDLVMNYDQEILKPVAVNKTDLTKDCLLVHNFNTPGIIKVATASSSPITMDGLFLTVEFERLKAGDGNVALSSALINENSVDVADSMADCNKDGEINIDDLVIVSMAYGTKQGEEGYDLRADLDKNGEVNMLDLAILASHYGK